MNHTVSGKQNHLNLVHRTHRRVEAINPTALDAGAARNGSGRAKLFLMKARAASQEGS
jgi:hypothetical protein